MSIDESMFATFRWLFITLCVLIVACAGSCSFSDWQHGLTQRACIASGREMSRADGICEVPSKPGEVKIR
jgi:hypothetical protein